MAGIISGAIPTAMAKENSRASISGRAKTTLTAKTKVVRTMATRNKKREKRESPLSKAVWLGCSERPAAIWPKAVRGPVTTTTPTPAPWCTTVPM